VEQGAEGWPGHPEIELALLKMYRATGNRHCLELCRHLIDVRGTDPGFYAREEERGWNVWGGWDGHAEYTQAHAPVREQTDAVGHAVRAVYLYTAMADLAAETGDETLLAACRRLWESITRRRMYVTGGIGSTVQGEAFTEDYDLPPDTAYAETCASIGLMFFASRLLENEVKAEYADVMELAFHNTVLAGMQLDGKRFFYVNPLEVDPGISGVAAGHRHVLPSRPGWYPCACCPPNVARLLTSLAEYAVQENEDGFTVHQYLDGTVEGGKGSLTLTTEYPWEGLLDFAVQAKEPLSLYLRIPAWANPQEVLLVADGEARPVQPERGFVRLDVPAGDHRVALSLPLKARRIYADPRVRADAGCVAFARGPLVYCLEGCDNTEPLWNLRADPEAEITVTPYDPACLRGIRKLQIPGARRTDGPGPLYRGGKPAWAPQTLTAIPYYAWANREPRDMRVWIRE